MRKSACARLGVRGSIAASLNPYGLRLCREAPQPVAQTMPEPITQAELIALVDLMIEIQRGIQAWATKRAEINRRIQSGAGIEPGPIEPAMIQTLR